MKIFKYKLYQKDEKWYANCPLGQIIRTDFVDDGYYFGHFVWVIVNPGTECFEREINFTPTNKNISGNNIQLGVLEKQFIHLPVRSVIHDVNDSQGMFWLYYTPPDAYYGLERVKIVGFKTGQEITENLDKMEYLGWCKIWIKQELAVYFFRVL